METGRLITLIPKTKDRAINSCETNKGIAGRVREVSAKKIHPLGKIPFLFIFLFFF